MNYSTINLELDIAGSDVLFEIEVLWYLCRTDGAFCIFESIIYFIDETETCVQKSHNKCPKWMHDAVEKSRMLYDHEDLIIDSRFC